MHTSTRARMKHAREHACMLSRVLRLRTLLPRVSSRLVILTKSSLLKIHRDLYKGFPLENTLDFYKAFPLGKPLRFYKWFTLEDTLRVLQRVPFGKYTVIYTKDSLWKAHCDCYKGFPEGYRCPWASVPLSRLASPLSSSLWRKREAKQCPAAVLPTPVSISLRPASISAAAPLTCLRPLR